MKKILITTLTIIICTITVFAATKNFTISSSNLSFENSKKQAIRKEFDKKYLLSHKVTSTNDKLTEDITSLSKKVTYLLLGEIGSKEETSEAYYNRHKEYLNLRYNPKIPEDKNTFTGLDENSQEYKDDIVSGTSVPSMFLIFDELDITYNSYGDIRVSKVDDGVISSVSLPNVKMRVENEEKPKEYRYESTNLILFYYFKKLNGEYKLYYIMGRTEDSLEDYLNDEASKESGNTVTYSDNYVSDLRNVYDFSKIDSLPQGTFDNIININKPNLMTINSYYNNYQVGSANAIVINDGLLVTTWDFIEDALINAQYISIKDSYGTSKELEGIVTVNIDSNIAVLKLKEKTNTKVLLADSKQIKTTDPVVIISSKTGTGVSLKKGIVVANDGYIQNSIPVTIEEQGSPLINSNGELLGITSPNSVNTSISLTIPSEALKEIQELFNNIEFENVKCISFKKLKEKFYYISYEKELVKNNINSNVWKEYKKIGNIEKTINLDLVKANYKHNVISLRYKNNINDYINSMQLASTFIEKLESDDFKRVSSSATKKVYQNNKYQITIMEEFDYLIIIMVKL